MKKKRISVSRIGVFALLILASAACGYLIGGYIATELDAGQSLPKMLLTLAAWLILLLLSIVLATVIHEAGHLVFGLFSGYGFSSFRIFNVMWLRDGSGKIRLKRFSIAGTGGQCLMTPPELKDGKMPIILYNLGGSLMNIIACVIFLAIYIPLRDVSLAGPLLIMLSAVQLVFALINGIPLKTASVNNDGYNAYMLARDHEAMRAFWVQMKVNEQQTLGVRASDMPDEWFSVPSDGAMKNSVVAVVGVFACNRLMEQKRFSEADNLMAHLLSIESGIAGIYRALMLSDRAYIALIEGRTDAAAALLGRDVRSIMRAMSSFPSVIRTEYAFALLLERDAHKAQGYIEAIARVAKSYPYPHDIEAERELMDIAAAAAENSGIK